MRALFLTTLLVACGEPASEPADAAEPEGGGDAVEAPYIYDDDGGSELPAFDAERTGEAVEQVLAEARRLSAAPVFEAYAEVAAGMDAGCPGWLNFGDTVYWYDSCTSGDGTQFDGYATTLEYDNYFDGDNTWSGYQYYGLASITTPAGAVFESAGSAAVLWGTNTDGANIYYTWMDDGFAYDGPAAEGNWLGDDLSPELVSLAYHFPSFDGRALLLSGRVLVEGSGVEAVVFDDVLIYDEGMGSTCPQEPMGTVSVLDSEGVWVDLVFDGPDWGETTDADLCDGCASAWFQGNYLGEACADFSELLSWETTPWE